MFLNFVSKTGIGANNGKERRSQASGAWLLAVVLLAGSALAPAARVAPARSVVRGASPLTFSRGKAAGFTCGYDPHGSADEALNHKANLSRQRSMRAASAPASPSQPGGGPRVSDAGDTALIEDDGSIVMPPRKFGLKNRSILLRPEGGAYRIAASSVSFSRNFGSRLDSFLAPDNSLDFDDGVAQVSLGASGFPFYGTTYDSVFVSVNGYVTLGKADYSYRPSAFELAARMPRIAPMWTDLDVSDSGSIYYNRLDGYSLITWNAAPEVLYGGVSTFQLALYDDGGIGFIYKKVKAHAGLTGVSAGGAPGTAEPIDLANPPADPVQGPLFDAFSTQKRLDLPALTSAFYQAHSDAFDMLYIWTDFPFDNGIGVAHTFVVRNDISGIGLPIFDDSAIYGSQSKLGSIVGMGDIADNWPDDPQAHVVGINSAISIVCHEQGHRWLFYVHFEADHQTKDDLLGRDFAHWSFLADSRSTATGAFSSLLEGNAWQDAGGGVFLTVESAVNYYNEVDQYLMGLRSPDEVGDISYLQVDDSVKAFLRAKSPTAGFSTTAARQAVSLSQIIASEGPRVPAAAPREFRIGFVLLTQQGSPPSTATVDRVARYRDALVRYFSTATARRGSLNASLAN